MTSQLLRLHFVAPRKAEGLETWKRARARAFNEIICAPSAVRADCALKFLRTLKSLIFTRDVLIVKRKEGGGKRKIVVTTLTKIDIIGERKREKRSGENTSSRSFEQMLV